MSKYKKTIIVFAIAVLMVSLFAVSKTLAKDIIFDPGTDNVGIGTSTPLFKLDVDGTGRFTSPLVVATPTASDHATTRSYVDSAVVTGDNYIGDSGNHTAGGTLFFSSANGIIQNQNSTSNYTSPIKWYKGGISQATYDPQIGQHNTGGTGTGSITILPYPTETSPWDGSVGLYISEGTIKYKGNTVWHASNDGSGSGLDADTVDGLQASSFLRSDDSDTMDAGVNTYLTIISDDTGKSLLSLYGDNQGTGQLFVGQNKSYGGGIEYNGDSSPVTTGAGNDYINLYRVNKGTWSWTARNQVGSNNWEFRGNVSVATPTSAGHATTKSYVDSVITSGDADTVDGLQASSFLRSDANDTFTASSLTLDSGAYLKTRLIGSLGTELGIGAGEMWSTMNGNITGETLWLGGESGVKIVSSPDNMGSGWTGRHEATLVNTDGNSTFPGDVTAAAFYYNSDKRLKDNIVSLGNESLDVIDKLNPVSFTWKEDGSASQGFIAQEVEQVLPELVKTNSETNMKSVQYANLTAVLTAGIKAQQEKINDLETELEILKIQVNSLKNN